MLSPFLFLTRGTLRKRPLDKYMNRKVLPNKPRLPVSNKKGDPAPLFETILPDLEFKPGKKLESPEYLEKSIPKDLPFEFQIRLQNPRDTSHIPFTLSRSSTGNQLPVYTDFKRGEHRYKTIVQKIDGDIPALVAELKKVTNNCPMRVKSSKIVIEGNYKAPIVRWLWELGF